MLKKYTVYGSNEIRQKIEEDLSLIKKEMLATITDIDHVRALILGGGYGRDEGGVLISKGKEYTFNDYDFFVIIDQVSQRIKKRIDRQFHDLHKKLTPVIGIDVDFGPALSVNQLQNLPFHLMWYELKKGYKTIWGDERILENMPEYQVDKIPVEEAVKLLLNRATGLILAKKRLDKKNPQDHEFILRNIMKARIAAGDAFLICNKDYSSSYLERVKILNKYSHQPLIRDHKISTMHHEAVEYKLIPGDCKINYEELNEFWMQTRSMFKACYLYCFSVFLKKDISNWKEYYQQLESSYPGGSLRDKIKNLLLNLKYMKLRNFKLSDYARYPRFRLYYCIPYLLFEDKLTERTLKIMTAENSNELKSIYFRLWERFN